MVSCSWLVVSCRALVSQLTTDNEQLTHLRVCSWESTRPPKPPDGVRILALVLLLVSGPLRSVFCRRGSTEKGAGLVNRFMLARIQPSALMHNGESNEPQRTQMLRRQGSEPSQLESFLCFSSVLSVSSVVHSSAIRFTCLDSVFGIARDPPKVEGLVRIQVETLVKRQPDLLAPTRNDRQSRTSFGASNNALRVCLGSHGSLRNCKARFDSSAGHSGRGSGGLDSGVGKK